MNKIYLIYGDEEYFIDEKLKDLRNKYNNFDFITYDMTDTNISVAVEDVSIGSLFSTNKVVICKNCVFLTGLKSDIEHNVDDLISYVSNPSDNILVLIVNNLIDNRKKIVKTLLKYSEVINCNALKDHEINKFIKDYCNKNGYKIDSEAIKIIISKLNNNLYIICSELDKIFIYKDNDKVISVDDVLVCTSKMLNTNIFDLINAIVKKDVNNSLMLYDDLVVLNEEEIKLVVILANQFRLIYQVKQMFSDGYSEFDIAKMLDVHPYRVKLANEVLISSGESLEYLKLLAKLDEDIKLGLVDKKSGFEKFILNLSI